MPSSFLLFSHRSNPHLYSYLGSSISNVLPRLGRVSRKSGIHTADNRLTTLEEMGLRQRVLTLVPLTVRKASVPNALISLDLRVGPLK